MGNGKRRWHAAATCTVQAKVIGLGSIIHSRTYTGAVSTDDKRTIMLQPEQEEQESDSEGCDTDAQTDWLYLLTHPTALLFHQQQLSGAKMASKSLHHDLSLALENVS